MNNQIRPNACLCNALLVSQRGAIFGLVLVVCCDWRRLSGRQICLFVGGSSRDGVQMERKAREKERETEEKERGERRLS